MKSYFKSLKRDFMATFPIVGPHADIEVELMLAGKKPLMWLLVSPDDALFSDWRAKKNHIGRQHLDRAVYEGKLIAIDVEQQHQNGEVDVIRHYAQVGNEQKLKKVVEFNKQAFNGKDTTDVKLGRDIGHYLGYRKRDVLFFNALDSDIVPQSLINKLIKFNAPFQRAHREKLLHDSGYDPQIWQENLQKLEY